MPKAVKWILLVVLPIALLLLLLRACVAVIPTNHDSSSFEARPMDTGILELKLGEHGRDLIARTPLDVRKGGVGGLTFYEVSDIATGTEPVVRLLHHGRVLEFPRARSVMMVEDTEQGWPVGEILIKIKMPESPGEAAGPDALEAYDAAVFALHQTIVDRIHAAGWKRYIFHYEPRIEGVETYRFEESYRPARVEWEVPIAADPSLQLTLEDWRNFSLEPSWEWYLDGAQISLSYSRGTMSGRGRDDKFRIEIVSDRTLLIGWDPKKNSNLDAGIANYKAVMPSELAKRKVAEQKAVSAGIPILTNYVDPPIGGIPVPAN